MPTQGRGHGTQPEKPVSTFASIAHLLSTRPKKLAGHVMEKTARAQPLGVQEKQSEGSVFMRFRQFMEPRYWLLTGALVSIFGIGRLALAADEKAAAEDFDVLIRGDVPMKVKCRRE